MRNDLTREEFSEKIYNEPLEVVEEEGTFRYHPINKNEFINMWEELDEEDFNTLRKKKIYKKDFDYIIQAIDDMNTFIFHFKIALENNDYKIDLMQEGHQKDTQQYYYIMGMLDAFKNRLRTDKYYSKAVDAVGAVYKNIRPTKKD